jgi:hypothetical protein
MATGRWQPSATKGVIWDAFDWGLGPEEVGSVAGVTTSAGSASGSEGDLGVITGITTSAFSVLGALGISASISGITDSVGTAQGTKPGATSRPGYYSQRPVPAFKPQPIAFKGEVFAYTFSRGTARGAQGLVGRAISAPLTTEGRATRSAWGYAGRIKAASHTKELRVRGWGRTNEERRREEDLLVLNLR